VRRAADFGAGERDRGLHNPSRRHDPHARTGVGLISTAGSPRIALFQGLKSSKDAASMSIELAEKLKAKLTDKWVVVDASVPELRRFANWTGKVKTVNMNCRALVEFDGAVDIGWYDIDPAFLTVVDGPRPKAPPKAEPKAKAAPAAEAAKPAAPAAKPAGMSPLEAARAMGAAKAGGAAKPAATPSAAAPAAAAPAGAKPSPLDLIRKQGAAKPKDAAPSVPPASEPAPAAAPVAETAPPPEAPKPAAPTPTTTPEGRKLSPLELARMQGAAKR
jgi:hypothetical protein